MGFHREISKGAKFVPRAGEGGDTAWHAQLQTLLDADRAENTGLAAWWERGTFMAQVTSTQRGKRCWLSQWSPKEPGAWPGGAGLRACSLL